ncbi:MAG: TylF/MycF family methyltransferase [Gammaproteobacteria bacterium]|nr:TylF/MycF family methyltransferase [Gammaproteobacteria bacterium]
MNKLRAVLKMIRNINSKDVMRRFESVSLFSKLVLPEYRMTWPQMKWWQNKFFNAYLEKFSEKDSFNTHRKWMLSQLIRLTEDVDGETAECGVYEGASSWLICESNHKQSKFKKTHHIFDSFEGLGSPEFSDGSYWKKGDLACSEESTLNNLLEFGERIVSHPGWIPDRFNEVENLKFSFVHVDVDLYEPTRDSIVFFYERLNPGAVFLCDDYGFTSCPGATMAVDEFLQNKPEKMIALDAGGGFFIKGVVTSHN